MSFLTAAMGEIAMPTARHVAALDPDTSVRITVLGSLDGESISVYLGNGKEGEEIKDPEQQETKVREYVEKALADGKTNVLIKAEAKVQEGQVNRISLAAAVEGMKLHAGVTEIDDLAAAVRQRLAPYLEGLEAVMRERSQAPLLVLFLGSNLSNFERPDAQAFLSAIRATLRPGDGLFVGDDSQDFGGGLG